MERAPADEPLAQVRCCTLCRAIYRAEYQRCPTDGAEIELVDGDPLVGTTLGEHYVIEACVGEGAMGRVYRARHARLDRKMFAVKVLLGDLAATTAMRMRFAHEADAASVLDHPNVVSVVDFGRSPAGLLYLVMDFVEGLMLGKLIETEGALPPDRVVALVRQMCRGLAHAHDRGLIHRDFKPDNVILASGVPRILDFGLAIAANASEGAARLTSVGVTVGTPIYAAPEQAANGTVDRRADLFALGVTMYEMLAGVPPFGGNLTEVLFRNATELAPPIAVRVPGLVVPPQLEAIARQLMAKLPDDRFPSARAVIAALDACDLHATAAPIGATATAQVAAPAFEVMSLPPPMARGKRGPVFALIAIAAIAVVAAVIALARPRPTPTAAPALAMIGDVVDARSGPPLDAGVVEADAMIAVLTPPIDAAAATVAIVRPDRALVLPIDAGVARSPIDAAPPPPPPPIDAAPPPTPIDAAPRVAPPIDAAARPVTPLLLSAAVGFDGLDVEGALSTAPVRRGLERALPALRACYRAAARAAGKSPATTVKIALTIDEQGSIDSVKGSGGALPTLASCTARALDAVRASAPDVGTVSVQVTVTFNPEAP